METMKGILYIQRKNGLRIEAPSPLKCEIDLGKDGLAIAGIDGEIKATLKRAQVDFISANGLMLSGVEDGNHLQLWYQEWWFIPG